MTSIPTPLSPLGRWYAVLAAIASVVALRATFFPVWPRAVSPSMNSVLYALRQEGLRPKPGIATAAERQGDRSQELSISSPVVLRFPGGEELRIVHGSFRQRYSLQAAAIAAKSPTTKLTERLIFASPFPFAEGTINGQPARQTCFVPQAGQANALGITSEQILKWVDRSVEGRKANALRAVGIMPNRDYSCILISMRSNNGTRVADQLWNRIVGALPAGLNKIPSSSLTRVKTP